MTESKNDLISEQGSNGISMGSSSPLLGSDHETQVTDGDIPPIFLVAERDLQKEPLISDGTA